MNRFRNNQVITVLFLALAFMAGFSAACSGEQATEAQVSQEQVSDEQIPEAQTPDDQPSEALDVVVCTDEEKIWPVEVCDAETNESISGFKILVTASDDILMERQIREQGNHPANEIFFGFLSWNYETFNQLSVGTHIVQVTIRKEGYRPATYDWEIVQDVCKHGRPKLVAPLTRMELDPI